MYKRIFSLLLLGSLLPCIALAQSAADHRADSAAFKSLSTRDAPAAGAPALDRGTVADLMSPADPLSDWMRVHVGPPVPQPDLLEQDTARGDDGSVFGHLEWRQQGGLEGLLNEYDALNERFKARLFGDDMSRRLELESNGRPGLQYRVDFD